MAQDRDIETGIPPVIQTSCNDSQSRVSSLLTGVVNERQPRHDGLYAQVVEDRQEGGQEPDEFYGSHDVENIAVKGFPSIAAYHARYSNTRTCRAFRLITQRLTIIYQCQLTCLLGALVNLDVEAATKSGTQGEKGCQPVPFDKEKFISRCLQSPDQMSLVRPPKIDDSCEEDDEQKKERIDAMRENLVANMERIFDKYCNRVNWQYELRKFPQASKSTHSRAFKAIRNISGLDPDALDYLRADDDFIYADADTLYERFHAFLVYLRAASVITGRFISCGRLFANEDAPIGAYNAQRVRLAVKFLMVTTCSALVLTPVGILYLNVPQKGIAFLVVALFGFVFAFTLIAFDNRMSHVLLGLAAYYAVLVVFLSVSD